MKVKYKLTKKWNNVVSRTLWMFEYFIDRYRDNFLLDDVDTILLLGLKNLHKINPEKLELNSDQLKFLIIMIDYVNIKMLEEIEPPYTEIEMLFFKQSQKFMQKFKTTDDIYQDWLDSKLELVEIIK